MFYPLGANSLKIRNPFLGAFPPTCFRILGTGIKFNVNSLGHWLQKSKTFLFPLFNSLAKIPSNQPTSPGTFLIPPKPLFPPLKINFWPIATHPSNHRLGQVLLLPQEAFLTHPPSINPLNFPYLMKVW